MNEEFDYQAKLGSLFMGLIGSNLSVADLNLPLRVGNALHRGGFDNLQQILAMSSVELMAAIYEGQSVKIKSEHRKQETFWYLVGELADLDNNPKWRNAYFEWREAHPYPHNYLDEIECTTVNISHILKFCKEDCVMSIENSDGVIEKIESFLREEKADKASCDFGFNVFETTGIVEKEVYVGNFLAELINPNGAHDQNFLYLDLFFKHVLNDVRHIEQTIVHTEYPTENNRWIDIVIEDGGRIFPIEVKIKAGDQKNQCSDYVRYTNSVLYYLTIDGHMPSDYSTEGLTADEIKNMIKPIAWKKNVIDWLTACIKATGEEHTDVHMNLRQYLSAVKKFCLLEAMDKCRKADKQHKGLDTIMRDKISEALWGAARQGNLGWKRLEKGVNTKDDGINYVLNDLENVFFRILCENGAIKAGKIFGLKGFGVDKENWIFSGSEYDIQRKEKYGKDWWIRVETIVTRNKSHLLFDEDCLRHYVDKIINLYKEMK